MSSPGREHPSVQPARLLSLLSSRGQVSPAQQELGPLCAQFGKNRSLCTGFIAQTQVLCALLPAKSFLLIMTVVMYFSQNLCSHLP